MLKVVAALVIGAVVLGVGVHYGRDRLRAEVHHLVDTSLPTVLEEHPWTPLVHGRARPAERLRFQGGAIALARCHSQLGIYTVHVDHQFAFHPGTTPIKAKCARNGLGRTLARVSRADLSTDHRRLTLTDQQGDVVLVLQGRGD